MCTVEDSEEGEQRRTVWGSPRRRRGLRTSPQPVVALLRPPAWVDRRWDDEKLAVLGTFSSSTPW